MPPARADFMKLSRMANAADYLAVGDVVGQRISSQQQWGLAPLHGAMSCLAVGYAELVIGVVSRRG